MSTPDKVKILLVDDQPARLLSYEVILQDLGQELVRVTSGAEALQRLMQDDYAVILLDVNMPGMDGFETAALIHQHPRFEKTPIIFVTALHVTDLDRLKGYELGAVDYVYIPVVPEILRSKVSVLVELYTKRRELQRVNESLKRANAELAEANTQLLAQKARELEDLNRTLAQANEELGRANTQLRAEVRVRRRAEEAMRRSEERLSTVLQNTSALIYQLDVDGRFVHVNRMFEELFHVTNDEVRGKSARDIFPAEIAAAFETNNRTVLGEGRRLEFEETLPFVDGVHVFSSIKAPIQDRLQPSGLVGVSTDISERKRLEEALKDADRRKDEFLAMLAHELRNPLAPIHNSLQLMAMKRIDDPELSWCRGVIENQTKQLTRLVDDLMDVSRITQGKFKLQKEPVELASIVANALQISHPLIEARNHRLEVDLPRDPVRVEADATRLAQVIGNLLNNAAKYTPPNGSIRLQVESTANNGAAGEAVIRVRDSGMGISSEMLPKLFELFTQLDRTLERAEGGLGVGLALVRRLVVLHGGTVSAHSEGAGKGSEFVVRLPLLSTEREILVPVEPPARRLAKSARRILVVDDNVDSALSLSLILKRSGNEVETAHDGLAGVEIADRFRPEVVLLDIGMPKMNGYDAARRIRQQPWGKEMLLIALTGWGQDEVRARIFEAGFDVHLIKPVDPSALANLLVAHPRAASAESCRT